MNDRPPRAPAGPAARRSLSFAAWLALRGGAPAGPPEPPPLRPDLRPDERLIWVHCPDPARAATTAAIAEALAADGQEARLVVTTRREAVADLPRLPRTTFLPVPADHRPPVRAFLQSLRPDLLLWMQGHFRPMLLAEAAESGLPHLLIDARAEALVLDGIWIPGATGALVAGFDHALAVDHLAAQRLARFGLSETRIEVTGALEALIRPPACNERERRDLTQTIGPRPIWLAAEVPMEELDAVIAAHRQAARAMHRLLLILAPARPEDHASMAKALRAAGLATASRWDGEEPEPTTEVYLADGPGEIGLWFRLSPISYLGGTLTRGASRHPFEAAALGTAILHGPRTHPHDRDFARLTRAGAARAVRGGQNLGHAVEALLASDRCATMVEAAWEVSTAGAVVANRLSDLIRDLAPRGAG